MQTILATFDDSKAAQSAIDQLIAQGFDRASVHLQTDSSTEPSGANEAGLDEDKRGTLSGIGHFFSQLFGSDDASHADNYSEAVRRGSSVVAVDASTDAEVEKATSLMNDMGSVDVEQRAAQWKRQGWKGFDPNAGRWSSDDEEFANQSVPVIQEKMQVGTRAVDMGGLRVIKRLTETPVSQMVNLRQERATVERLPVDRVATDADHANFREGTVEVREMAEEAVVSKTAHVVEEVRIGKQTTEKSTQVVDTVHGTDVAVERVAAEPTVSPTSKH